MTSIDKALSLLRSQPRVSFLNLADLPRSRPPRRSAFSRKKRGLGHRGISQFQAWLPLGSLERKTPFYITVPKEPYNSERWNQRPMKKISLLELQRMIDLNRIDTLKPIDITTICNTGLYPLYVETDRIFGFHLTEEGADDFVSPVAIEIQHAEEHVIAAVERVGGFILSKFYDPFSVFIKSNPIDFFKRGIPLPKVKLPPENAMEYYAGASSRGYLANPADIAEARIWLAQKYGYHAFDMNLSPLKYAINELYGRDTRQMFSGLKPGCLVNLADKCVLYPTKPELKSYFSS